MTISADPHHIRDYSLTGTDTERAKSTGLAGADWYHTEVPRKVLKDLMQRRDGPALRDTAIWFALLGLSAWGHRALAKLVGGAAMNRVNPSLVAMGKDAPMSIKVDAPVPSFVTSCQRVWVRAGSQCQCRCS